jgi:hypothetical protein
MLESELLVVGGSVGPGGALAKTGPQLRWELQQMMSQITPDDLSTAEISCLLAILTPAHARVVGGRIGRWIPDLSVT